MSDRVIQFPPPKREPIELPPDALRALARILARRVMQRKLLPVPPAR